MNVLEAKTKTMQMADQKRQEILKVLRTISESNRSKRSVEKNSY